MELFQITLTDGSKKLFCENLLRILWWLKQFLLVCVLFCLELLILHNNFYDGWKRKEYFLYSILHGSCWYNDSKVFREQWFSLCSTSLSNLFHGNLHLIKCIDELMFAWSFGRLYGCSSCISNNLHLLLLILRIAYWAYNCCLYWNWIREGGHKKFIPVENHTGFLSINV